MKIKVKMKVKMSENEGENEKFDLQIGNLLPLSRNRGHLGGFLLFFFFSNCAKASKHSGTKTSSGFPPLADQWS
jgi:hypothetical protein